MTMPASEAELVEGDLLSRDRVSRLLYADDFDKSIRRLADDARGDALAADLTALYSGSLSQRLAKESDGIALQDIACGHVACMALVVATDEAASNRFREMLKDDPRAPVFAMMMYVFPQDAGTIETRVVFATDDRVGGFTTGSDGD